VGHGLATAWYLASEYGVKNVGCPRKRLDRVRQCRPQHDDHPLELHAAREHGFYELSMKLWERMEQDLNYNTMVSQRGIVNLYHSDAQRDAFVRRGNVMRINGIDAELLDLCPGPQNDALFSISKMRGFRSRAGSCSAAPARLGTTRSSGLCPCGQRARRRRHPELRGHRLFPSERQSDRRRDDAWNDRRRQGRHSGSPAAHHASRDGRHAPARSKATCFRPSSPKQSSR